MARTPSCRRLPAGLPTLIQGHSSRTSRAAHTGTYENGHWRMHLEVQPAGDGGRPPRTRQAGARRVHEDRCDAGIPVVHRLGWCRMQSVIQRRGLRGPVGLRHRCRAGEITWIEAWSDLDGMRPTTADDPWAERPGVPRLSDRIPGLGTPTGWIDLDSEAMRAARSDPDVDDFVVRANDWFDTWSDELAAAGDDMWARGCGW